MAPLASPSVSATGLFVLALDFILSCFNVNFNVNVNVNVNVTAFMYHAGLIR